MSITSGEQLEHQCVWQHEAYRCHTNAESNEQSEYQCKNGRGAYTNYTNATCAQIYNTNAIFHHCLGSIEIECSQCQALHWTEEKVASSVLFSIFNTCCANGKIKLPTVN
ncbi:27144_t:CDS:1 [Gigaspora margarita]|uniref:27144_t:CDS:1 n=1 Tax=Gigaspora margarita TaxID=4874 RepID=A0ABN7V956_GIGMA|nr:27144_t:CDS:1 [Gigaspora margarita]